MVGLEDLRGRWHDIVAAVRARSAVLAGAVESCRLKDVGDGRVTLGTPHGNAFVAGQLRASEARRTIEEALSTVLGARMELAVVEESAAAGATAEKKSVYDDPSVRKFIEHFDGGITDVEKENG